MDKIHFNSELKYSEDFVDGKLTLVKDNSISSQNERRPNWWRTSDSEDIFDPCFKKPIYAGKSKFDFSPTFLKNNMKWFKNRMLPRITIENNSEYNEYDKTVQEYNRQKKMTQEQEYSQYKYISPYSEYLLERLKWKIALRIYYTLDPNNKGYIELEHSKKILLDMLELDTEMAQSLLLLLETIKPFYAKDGCVEKNDIIVYLAREIFDDTRGYGLFSRLNKIFKNPIIRSKRQNICNQSDCFQKLGKNSGNICFSSDPNVINLNDTNTMRTNLKGIKNNISHCHNKKGTCITCNMKKNCTGKLKDHIEMTRDRRQKLINQIKQERKNANEKNMLNCTFKPEIIWPIGRYIKKNSQLSKEKKNASRSKLNRDQKHEISGYEIINEQDLDDKNVQIFLNNNFNSDNNWNGYIHDSISNKVYILHKGYLMNDSNIDENKIFYRKTDMDNQIEVRGKELDSIIRKICFEFKSLEKIEKENEKKSSVNFGSKKLIEELRAKRGTGTNDPRLNIPEFTIEVNHPKFAEKTVDLTTIKPYKESAIHGQMDANNEYSTKSCYNYLPSGYEMIGKCFNEVRLRRKLDLFCDSQVTDKNKDHNHFSSNEHLNTFRNNDLENKNNSPRFIDDKSVNMVDKEKIEGDTRKDDVITTPLKEENMINVKKNNLKMPPQKDTSTTIKEDKTPVLVKNNLKMPPVKGTSVAKFNGETKDSVPVKINLKIPSNKGNSATSKEEIKSSISTKDDIKIPLKKDTLVASSKQDQTPQLLIKNDLKIPPKKDTLVASSKQDQTPQLLIKNDLKIPPKKDTSVSPLKEVKTQVLIKSSLKVPPKNGTSATVLNEQNKDSIPIKNNIKVPLNKDTSISPLKEAKTQVLIKNNLKIPPKKGPIIN